MWDEDRMKEMDLVLDEARKAGVKLIIPIINQDTGDESVSPSHSLAQLPCARPLIKNVPFPQLELGRIDS